MLEARLDNVRMRLAANALGALLVTDLSNIFYLSGFTGSSAMLVVTQENSHILVDPRYSIQASNECKFARVVEYSGRAAVVAAAQLLGELKLGSVGYEADNLTVTLHRQLRKLTDTKVTLRSTREMVEKLRRVKDSGEISLMRVAAGIADSAFEAALTEIRPGMSEREVALLIDSTLRRMGADKESFETIAATGPNSACPHAKPTDARLEPGQFLKMDFGARYENYCSDITRTVCIGKPTKKHKEIYQIVLDAQLKAIDAIAPGKSGREIDAVARDYIASKGYGENFGHGLGHGLGIEVHDHVGLSQTSDLVLEPGVVVTVEPGIYIEGWGGVRIEDDVVVTDSGADVLTEATKELCILDLGF